MLPPQSDFQFINYVGEPSKSSRLELTKVRKHVMHDYFKKHTKSPRPSGASPTPRENTHRSMRPTVKVEDKDEFGKPRQIQKQLTVPRLAVLPRKISPAPRHKSTEDVSKAPAASSRNEHLGLSMRLCSNSIDPFNTLPITGSSEVEQLLRWFHTIPESRKTAWCIETYIWWKGSFLTLALQDPGLFHLLLRFGEARRSKVTGICNQIAWLEHTDGAIASLRERMPVITQGCVSDSLLVLISAEVDEAVADNNLVAAKAHLLALTRLLDHRSSSADSFAMEYVAWADLRLAAATTAKPTVCLHIWSDIETRCLPMMKIARERSLLAIATLPSIAADFYDWVVLLHQTCLAQETIWRRNWKLAFESISKATYCIADVVSMISRPRGDGTLVPRDIVAITGATWIWASIASQSGQTWRSGTERAIEAKYSRLLYDAILQVDDIMHLWNSSGATLDSLLWVVFTALAAWLDLEDFQSDEQGFAIFGYHIAPLVTLLIEIAKWSSVITTIDLEERLRIFPWANHFCGKYCPIVAGMMKLQEVE